MDTEAVTTKMRQLYEKATAARKEGKGDIAKSFRAGARRLQRQIKADLISRGLGKKKKKAD